MMYFSKPIILLFYLILIFNKCEGLTRTDFYDYKRAQALNGQYYHIDTPVKYPHWSDLSNSKIDIINSGVVRFSGLDASNTLDILIFATQIPQVTIGDILYEEVLPEENLKANFTRDLKVNDFVPKDAVIATWIDVQFSPGKYSTFQMIFTTDGNTTYLIMHIERIEHESNMQFFPEVDLRYSYEEGTKFQRAEFLREETGISSGTTNTASAAEDNTNSGKVGRWILNLTADPKLKITTTTPPEEGSASPVSSSQVNNASGTSVKGKFKFPFLSLDGNVLTNGRNIDEISILLTKKEKDQRYITMNQEMINWIRKIYEEISGSGLKMRIMAYRAGSLTIDYSVEVDSSVCQKKTGPQCVQHITDEVKKETSDGSIVSGELSGTIDSTATTISDFDECSEEAGAYCDVNAHCLDYPNELSYGCACKDGYNGDGFPGNCKKEKDSKNSNLIIIIAVVSCVLITICIAAFVYYVKRKEKHNALKRSLTSNDPVKHKAAKRSILKRKSTRKVLVPVKTEQDETFDLYHRT